MKQSTKASTPPQNLHGLLTKRLIKKRISNGKHAMEDYVDRSHKRVDPPIEIGHPHLVDLLTDLRHWAKVQADVDFEIALETSFDKFHAELAAANPTEAKDSKPASGSVVHTSRQITIPR